jgi:hypothetical protein
MGDVMTKVVAAVMLTTASLLAGATALTASSAQTRLRFPARTPQYIVVAAERSAQSLGDRDATVVSVQLGRFPVVVLTGTFRCPQCSRPTNSTPVQTGRYASLRFDGVTHQVTDFGLSPSKPTSRSDLCGAGNCASRKTIALQAALKALQAFHPLVTEPFGIRIGKLQCEIRLPIEAYRWIWGTCDTTISLEKQQTVVTFSETWNGLDPNGRRYAPDSPVHHHVWQIIESPTG